MKGRYLSLVLLLICTTSTISAGGKMSAYTQMFLKLNNRVELTSNSVSKNSVFPKSVSSTGAETVLTIITLDDEDNIPDMPENVAVEGQIGKLLIARTPIDKIREFTTIKGIKKVSVEQPVKLKNNITRAATLQDKVNETLTAAGDSLTGKGVVVGIIDTGIDYNHINFKDSNGNSRVKMVIDGASLTEYTSEDAIAKLTTDNTETYHGTHTAGTAAGSYKENGLYGMAPEADLVLCGLNNEFTDANILLCMKKIYEYAKSVGKPAVINISLGSNFGSHDGNDEFSIGVEELCKEGAIAVVSAGNEGDMSIYLNKKFTTKDNTVKTILSDYSNGGTDYYNMFEIYNFDGNSVSLQFLVLDIVSGKEVYSTEKITLTKDQQEWTLDENSSTFSSFKKYYKASSTYSTGPVISTILIIENKTCCLLTLVVGSASSRYYIAVKVFGEDGQEIHMFGSDSYTEFISENISGYTAGNAEMSFNTMVCSPKVIGVGAYTESNSYKTLDGRTHSSSYKKGAIAPFSSYGTDFNGYSHPDISAPGLFVVSSVNSYYGSLSNSNAVSRVKSGNRTYEWTQSSGTSMACPAVTGIIATWLQYKPTLSAPEIKEIFKATAVIDSTLSESERQKFGYGKIDAYAGLEYIINSGVNDVEVKQNNVLLYPVPNHGQFKLYVQGEYNGALLNIYNMSGSLVYSSPVNASDEAIDVDLSNRLDKGIYIVNVRGEKVNYSTRMIVN